MPKKSSNRARRDYAAYAIIGPDGRHVLTNMRMQIYWMRRTAESEADSMRKESGDDRYTVEDVIVYRPKWR